MKLRNSFFMLALSVSMAFLISSCTTESEPIVPSTAPTNVEANSASATAISVRWTRDATDVTPDTIIAIDQITLAEVKTPVLSTASEGIVTGLQLNKKYDITIGSAGGRSAKLTWMTATRSGVITISETGDPGNPSGLILGPVPRVVSTETSDSTLIDLVLASRNDVPTPFISLQAASGAKSGIVNGRATLVDDYYEVPGGLDKDYYKSAFSTPTSDGFDAFVAVTSGNPVVMVVKTADNHYARVEIMPQPSNGNKLWKIVGGGFRAIDVIVSYQPTIDAAYAGRPAATRRGTEVPVRFSRRGGIK